MSAPELAQLLVAAATLVSSLAALIVAVRSAGKVSATHDLVNGQTQHIAALGRAEAHRTGVQEGVALERDRPAS